MDLEGCANFRQRLSSSILCGKRVKMSHIRDEDENPGLQDYEASFLRLMDTLTDGTRLEINETGTTMKMKPGIIVGGRALKHDCGTSRAIGWFIEGIIPLAVFGKESLEIQFTGITNDNTDLSVDILKTVTLPLLRNFGIEGVTIDIKKRGFAPNGGGVVYFKCPSVRELHPIDITDMGLIKRVRGNALAARVSPTILTRVIESSRGVLNHYLPDVFINTDHHRGSEGGHSAGYTLSLVAESTTGVLLSVERTAEQGELPENIGKECAFLLLEEIKRGGVIDSSHQALILQLMILGPEDVCKVRFGELTEHTVLLLRLIKEAFGVVFKIVEDKETNTVILSCLGTGFQNVARKVR